jgi:hypothetical protein
VADTGGHHFNEKQQKTLRAVMALSEGLTLEDCQDLVQTSLLGGIVERNNNKWTFEFPKLGEESRVIYVKSLFGYARPDFIKDLRFAILDLGIHKSCL